MVCDLCNSAVLPDETRFQCKTCDFDVCVACYYDGADCTALLSVCVVCVCLTVYGILTLFFLFLIAISLVSPPSLPSSYTT